jgi:imidazolonepropionase-like amidohydrolase
LRRALSYGLSADVAMNALTLAPAKLLGVENEIGSLDKGKRANFIITSPDLFRKQNARVFETWVAGQKVSDAGAEATTEETLIAPHSVVSELSFPNTAYGVKNSPTAGNFLIKGATVWTSGPVGVLKNADVYIENGKIQDIGIGLRPASNDYEVIEANGLHVTPGLIDEHSHIAISDGVNEAADTISAEVRIGDVLDPDDIAIYRQLSGGVTASQLLHGSANAIGGQSALIKLRWGASADELKIAQHQNFMKFALGENPRQANWGDRYVVRYPQTRMGVMSIIEDSFQRAWAYGLAKQNAASKQQPFHVNLQLEPLWEVLQKQRFITCHSYVQSEILSLMDLSKKMGFKVNTFTHVLEGYKIAAELASYGASAATFSDWWSYKAEVRQAIPYNAALMTRAGVNVSINSDDSEMARRLNQEAAKSIKYGGLSEEEALRLVTINPAKALHLNDRMGSLEAGKDADLVIWSGNPLSLKAKAMKTFVDGRLYFDRERDLKARSEIEGEKQAIWHQMQSDVDTGATLAMNSSEVKKLRPHAHEAVDRCEEVENDYNH